MFAELPTRPALRHLLWLAWPIVITRSTQVVVGMADAIMVAPLGEAAIAAVTAGAMNCFALLALQIGIVFIVNSFASQLTGRGDHAGARRYALYGLLVALGSEVAVLLAIPHLDVTLGWLALAPDVHAEMQAYMSLRLLSAGAAVGLEALGNYYGATGNTVLPMIGQIVAMVLNVALNWVFIGGELGMPALGVAGAGLASSLATTIAFAFVLVCFVRHIGAPQVRAGRLHARELWRMLRFGLPVGLNWFIELYAFLGFVNVVLAGLGTTALAATMAVMQINSVAFMPAFALATAGSIFVGQAIGRDRKDDVGFILRQTLILTVGWQGGMGLVYWIAPTVWLAPFTPEGDGSFLAIGVSVLILSAAWQLFDGAAMALAEALRAAGDTTFSMWARAILGWLVFLPGALVTTRWLDGSATVACLWLIVYLGLLALVLGLRFRAGTWRSLELVEPTAHPSLPPAPEPATTS